jgi:hypothetical protein
MRLCGVPLETHSLRVKEDVSLLNVNKNTNLTHYKKDFSGSH